jgi:MFS family permease
VTSLRTRLRSTTSAARAAAAEPALARLQVAWLCVHAGKSALLVVNLIIAYAAGGVVGLGIFGLARFLVPTILAPFAGLPTARWPAARVLVTANALRTVAVLLVLATVVGDWPIDVFFLAVALEAGAGSLSRPLHVALLPYVSRSPEALVAANVTSSAVEAIGTFVGPAVAGILLASGGPATALTAVVAFYAVGVAAIVGLDVRALAPRSASLVAIREQALAGVRTFREDRGPRLILTGIFLQTLVRGMLNVLVVVAALDILGMGESGVGNLNAALGAGGLLGAAVALSLAGRRTMSAGFAMSLAAWSAPLLLVGLVPIPAVAVAAMLAIGMANAVVDVTAYTLLQRTTARDRRVGVLGLFDSLANGGQAAGGIIAPFLVAGLGIQGALIAAGLTLPVAAVALWPGLRATDPGALGSDRRRDLVRGVPLFGPLSMATVEDVAAQLRPVSYDVGAWLIREGEPGQEFLIVDEGDIEVSQGGRVLRMLGPGAAVGEIALLHDIPRTASVRAIGPVRAFSLSREDFLVAAMAAPALGT